MPSFFFHKQRGCCVSPRLSRKPADALQRLEHAASLDLRPLRCRRGACYEPSCWPTSHSPAIIVQFDSELHMNRKRFLRIHGISAETWAQRHDLDQYARPCSRCGAMLTTSIPFASGTLRGLAAPACVCGNENTPYVVVRDARYGDLLTGALVPTRDRVSGGNPTVISVRGTSNPASANRWHTCKSDA